VNSGLELDKDNISLREIEALIFLSELQFEVAFNKLQLIRPDHPLLPLLKSIISRRAVLRYKDVKLLFESLQSKSMRYRYFRPYLLANVIQSVDDLDFKMKLVNLSLKELHRKTKVKMSYRIAAGKVYLSLAGSDIKSIGILQFVPLAELDLSDTAVVDLSAIPGEYLTKLNLSGTPVKSLSDLKAPHLTWLSLRGTQMGPRIGAVMEMPNLRDLDISDTRISLIMNLIQHPSLRRLTVDKKKAYRAFKKANLTIELIRR
jgi:Leucine-rich repeat (LRR) protein